MNDLLSITVDPSAVLAAIERFAGPDLAARLQRAAMQTATAIQTGGRTRVARGTGQTAENITATDRLPSHLGADELDDQPSAFVYVAPVRRPDNLAIWLEFGTQQMAARPFLLNAARVEEGRHLQRVTQVLTQAIDDAGLGD